MMIFYLGRYVKNVYNFRFPKCCLLGSGESFSEQPPWTAAFHAVRTIFRAGIVRISETGKRS